MEIRTLLITTVLCTSLAFGIGACSNDNYKDHAAAQEQTTSDPRFMANRFVKHVNYARMELAMNHPDLARKHINEARNFATAIGDETADQRIIDEVKAGRVSLAYDRDYEHYYFPLETGAMEHQKPSNPLWIQKGPAITDAEIVTLTLDLNSDEAMRRLDDADAAINAGKLKEAEGILAKLSASIITADSEISDPLEKTRANLMLARRFIMDSNYDGARFALNHADEGLNEMVEDDTYHAHHAEIVTMRSHIHALEADIAKNKPSLTQKADAKVKKWWEELKDWVHE